MYGAMVNAVRCGSVRRQWPRCIGRHCRLLSVRHIQLPFSQKHVSPHYRTPPFVNVNTMPTASSTETRVTPLDCCIPGKPFDTVAYARSDVWLAFLQVSGEAAAQVLPPVSQTHFCANC